MKKVSFSTFGLATGALLVFAFSSTIAFAQAPCQQQCQPPTAAQLYRAGFDANVHWPNIYIPPARRSVCATYDAMINNGWRRQNLLGDYHFNQDSHQLTDAGKLKVNWILSQAPQQRRSVFVQRGAEQVDTSARIAAVHDHAGSISPGVGSVVVNDTHIVAEGHSASSVDNVFQAYGAIREQLPPTTPFIEVSSSSSSSSGQ